MTFPNAHAKTQRREVIWISKRQWFFAALRLCVIFSLLSFSVAATAQTNTLSDAEIQGRQLAQQLCDARPTTNFTQTGVLQIRDGKGVKIEYPFLVRTFVGPTDWSAIYQIIFTNHSSGLEGEGATIQHLGGQKTLYASFKRSSFETLSGSANVLEPFANSDFWLCDLGLEFFHWPQQKVLPKTTNLKRGREYTLLESTNPNPATNGYSRVRSWIDKESGGLLQAEAYDAKGEKLKEFWPKSFGKVNDQWQVEEIQIRNVQTDSRTRLVFDLKK